MASAAGNHGIAGAFVQYLKGLPILDRRVVFDDLAKRPPADRQPQSPVIQFYSPDNNIGNFTPVLGIREMLGRTPDTWSIHDKRVDFDFINRNYKCAIIGGAGLLHEAFQPFWDAFASKCRIPAIIWGVGVCLPDTNPGGVSRKTVAAAAAHCDLINIRDELTRDHYSLNNADISACPTLVYLVPFRKEAQATTGSRLFSSHTQLVDAEETNRLIAVARHGAARFRFTDNVQRRRFGVADIIRKRFCPSELVIATRLHGAIIAHGLNIPYIAVARDSKVRDFVRLYGNGLCVESAEELADALSQGIPPTPNANALDAIRKFGRRAKEWVDTHINASSSNSRTQSVA